MDEQTLGSLKAALARSPDNVPLFVVVLRAQLENGALEAIKSLLAQAPLAAISAPEDRTLVAEALLKTGSPELAMGFADANEPHALLVRARALAELERTTEARAAYAAAVEQNPTLEDLGLLALLGARVTDVAPPGRARLKVISNDDTDSTEVVRLLIPEREKVTFADVGGLDEVKQQIRKRIILPFKKPSLFQRFKKRVGGGILLYGPPGCGKTLLARATAGECDAAFFNVAISDVLDMYIGESERKLHAVFEKARSSAPAVLFFDELEALAGKRQHSREGTSSKLVSQFLSEMDGFTQANQGVLILGATNVPWAVDAAFRRPGRFDRVLFVPPPDKSARQAILQRLIDNRPVAENVDPKLYAGVTSGFSGADLEHLMESASDEAIEASLESESEVPVRRQHFDKALKSVKPTTLEWLTTARNYARYANEAGHYDEVLEFLRRHGKS